MLEALFLLLGVLVATGGGLLALIADPDRPAQCIPVFALAASVFLGGMALMCWFQPMAEYVQTLSGG